METYEIKLNLNNVRENEIVSLEPQEGLSFTRMDYSIHTAEKFKVKEREEEENENVIEDYTLDTWNSWGETAKSKMAEWNMGNGSIVGGAINNFFESTTGLMENINTMTSLIDEGMNGEYLKDSLDYDPYDEVILANDAWLESILKDTLKIYTQEQRVADSKSFLEKENYRLDSISYTKQSDVVDPFHKEISYKVNIVEDKEHPWFISQNPNISTTNLKYVKRAEDMIISNYIQPIYSDVQKFCDCLSKMMKSDKLFNSNAFEAILKKGNTQVALEDFRYDGIDTPEEKKNTSGFRYGPTGGTTIVSQLASQTNTFNMKVLLSRNLKELMQFATFTGLGFADPDKGLNLGYLFEGTPPDEKLSLTIRLKSNAWVNRIGQAGFNPDRYGLYGNKDIYKELINTDKEMPGFYFEDFKVRIVKFPLDFDAGSKKPAELELTCSAFRVYPIV